MSVRGIGNFQLNIQKRIMVSSQFDVFFFYTFVFYVTSFIFTSITVTVSNFSCMSVIYKNNNCSFCLQL